MSNQYTPMKRFTDLFPETSGNSINGLGETEQRRPAPFFWHPPSRQTHAALQKEVTDYHRQSEAVRTWYSPDAPGGRGPKPVEQAAEKVEKSADEWTQIIKSFMLENESDLVGITATDPMQLYEGYEIDSCNTNQVTLIFQHK